MMIALDLTEDKKEKSRMVNHNVR